MGTPLHPQGSASLLGHPGLEMAKVILGTLSLAGDCGSAKSEKLCGTPGQSCSSSPLMAAGTRVCPKSDSEP